MPSNAVDTAPLLDCYTLWLIGIYCLLVMIGSIVFNGLLLLILYKYRELRTPVNKLVALMAILNLISACLSLPMVIISNLNCK